MRELIRYALKPQDILAILKVHWDSTNSMVSSSLVWHDVLEVHAALERSEVAGLRLWSWAGSWSKRCWNSEPRVALCILRPARPPSLVRDCQRTFCWAQQATAPSEVYVWPDPEGKREGRHRALYRLPVPANNDPKTLNVAWLTPLFERSRGSNKLRQRTWKRIVALWISRCPCWNSRPVLFHTHYHRLHRGATIFLYLTCMALLYLTHRCWLRCSIASRAEQHQSPQNCAGKLSGFREHRIRQPLKMLAVRGAFQLMWCCAMNRCWVFQPPVQAGH